MLNNTTIYLDKENRVGHQAKLNTGGAESKHRKGLGVHAGNGPENALPPGTTSKGKKGTGLSFSNSNKFHQSGGPLGARKQNASGPGKGERGFPTVNAKKSISHRKKLGDISNREQGQGVSSGLGGAGGSTKLNRGKAQTARLGGVKSGSTFSAISTAEFVPEKKELASRVARPTAAAKTPGSTGSKDCVPEIEMAMGRLGDEEELLVQRRDEERFAETMSKSFRTSTHVRHAACDTQIQRPSAHASRSSTSHTLKELAAVNEIFKKWPSDEAVGGSMRADRTAGDDKLRRAIDKVIRDDFEEMLDLNADTAEHIFSLGREGEWPEDPAWLAEMGQPDAAPMSPLDDVNFLSQDLDLSFA